VRARIDRAALAGRVAADAQQSAMPHAAAIATVTLLAAAVLAPGADQGGAAPPGANPPPREDPGDVSGCRFVLTVAAPRGALPPAAAAVRLEGWTLSYERGACTLSVPTGGDARDMNEYNILDGHRLELHQRLPALVPNAQALAPRTANVRVTVRYRGEMSADHQRCSGRVTWAETDGQATTAVEFAVDGAPPAPASSSATTATVK
jgi:hypothetical protein